MAPGAKSFCCVEAMRCCSRSGGSNKKTQQNTLRGGQCDIYPSNSKPIDSLLKNQDVAFAASCDLSKGHREEPPPGLLSGQLPV